MKSRPRLAAIIGAIVGAAILAFCAGMLFTLAVIMPARRGAGLALLGLADSTVETSPSPAMVPSPLATPLVPSATPTYALIILTPTDRRTSPTPEAAVTSPPTQSAVILPSSTPTSGQFPYYYVKGSRTEQLQCFQPYLQGWVRDGTGAPLDGVTVCWQYWNRTECAISGDPQKLWQSGEFKFTYYAEDPRIETDFVLQIVQSEGNPVPLSEPLLIRYAGCGATGQITNIVFKRW